MATEAQIAANRVNAQKSTGPRTAEGKRVVSQNAITHGLFANETVIKCESIEQFELHRDAMLSELLPVGVMESFLAERIVSLSWRMMRAERMQNQATDCMMEEDHLSLGRMATKKWSNNVKTLEKLLMLERRLESSFYRTMNKLKTAQTMRRIEWEDAAERSAAQTVAAENNDSDFAKQSQLARELMGVTPFGVKDYEDISSLRAAGKKANRSQSDVQRRACKAGKGEIATALRASQ